MLHAHRAAPRLPLQHLDGTQLRRKSSCLVRALIVCQTDQKFEKFQRMPEPLELVPDVVTAVGAAGTDGAEVPAPVYAAVPFCGGANL